MGLKLCKECFKKNAQFAGKMVYLPRMDRDYSRLLTVAGSLEIINNAAIEARKREKARG